VSVALDNQICNAHAMYYIVICGLILPDFSTLSHKRHDFRQRDLNIKCVVLFTLQRLSGTFLILTRMKRDIIINVYICLHVKYLLFVSDINET
jgi:hypothetical protein